MAKPTEPPIYRPEPESLAHRLLTHLLNAGGDEDAQLDRNDVAELFRVAPARVHTDLAAAVIAGALKRGVNPDGEAVYSMGRAKVDLGLTKRRRSEPIQIDVTKIKVERDVPLPRQPGTSTRWHTLLGRMLPGDSFALPMPTRSSLQKAVGEFKTANPGTRFTVRRMEDGTVRCWRLEDAKEAGHAAQ